MVQNKLNILGHLIKRIPNFITLINGSLGFLAIIFSLKSKFLLASILILLAAILDGLDGFLARKLNAVSKIGKELDSLSDLVSFAVAPALLLIIKFDLNFYLIIVGILLVASSEYRLARYNVSSNVKGFSGVPTTLSAIILAFISMFLNSVFIICILILFLAILQVSHIKVKRVFR